MSATQSYRVPRLGYPLYWHDEQSGVLAKAVTAYLDGKETEEQLALVIDYCAAWVEAPVWAGEGVVKLRESIKQVKTHTELKEWLWKALDDAIDPL